MLCDQDYYTCNIQYFDPLMGQMDYNFFDMSTNISISTIFTIHVDFIVMPFSDSTIDCLMSKIFTSITMSKKEILIPGIK
jgi:hypothetical protein